MTRGPHEQSIGSVAAAIATVTAAADMKQEECWLLVEIIVIVVNYYCIERERIDTILSGMHTVGMCQW